MSYLPQILFHYPDLEKHREVIIGSEYKKHKDNIVSEAWAKIRDVTNRPEKYNVRTIKGKQLCLLASPDLTAQSKAMQKVLAELDIDYALFD